MHVRMRGDDRDYVSLCGEDRDYDGVVYRGAITGEPRLPPVVDMDVDPHRGPHGQHEGDVDDADEYALGEENDEEGFCDDL